MSRVGCSAAEHAKRAADGLGLFVRSLVGLDRDAAKGAMARFLEGGTPSANQIEFVNLIIEHLTEHGTMDPASLYESPFTDVAPLGPESLFASAEVEEIVAVLREIRATAVGG